MTTIMHEKYLLILFYSATGAVKNLAHAIADGAEKRGLQTRIRTVPKVSATSEAVNPIFLKKVKSSVQKMIWLTAQD